MSDATIISIIGSVITLGGTMFAGWMTFKMTQLKMLAESTHTLVNSAMGIQLAMHESATQQLAAITKDPIDLAAALAAKQKNAEHIARQAVVDARSRKLTPIP